jgi:FemAB-related protein (PEP-CTERM system-associated)
MIRTVTEAADAWRHTVNDLHGSSLAHAPEWLDVIRRGYGHEPLYLTEDDEPGVLPAFVVRRPVFGTIVTSMPFLDGGGPCSASPAVTRGLVDRLIAEAGRIGAVAVELRCSARLAIAAQPLDHKVNLAMPLPEDSDQLWRRLESRMRNHIRKAEKSGLTVVAGGVEHLPAFDEVFAARMRELGSPPHAPRFLRAVVGAFGDRARVLLVRKDRLPIGGLVALRFKDTVTIPWASCLTEYRALAPNTLLYWEAIRSACAQGARRFDFGRSSRGSGTYRFKLQWGAEESPLFWYTLPVSRRPVSSASSRGRAAACATEIWRRLPLAVTRRVGPHIRKYLIQ